MANIGNQIGRATRAATNVMRMPAYQGRQTNTGYTSEDRRDAENERKWKFEQYKKSVTTPRVPMTVQYGSGGSGGGGEDRRDAENERRAGRADRETAGGSNVPRERWVRSYAAQMQGPLQSGQKPGMPPYIGPYAGDSQRIPQFLDPRTMRYTPQSKSEYQTWLSGEAFGSGSKLYPDSSVTDLNARRSRQGLPPINAGELQMSDEQRKAWGDAIDIEDAVSRSAKRNTIGTFGGVGDALSRYYAQMYQNLKKATALPVADRRYDAIEDVRMNRGAPSDNLSAAAEMPAYAGNGGGGYGDDWGGWGGGGGGGGGDYSPGRWMQNLYAWRL